MGGCLVGGGGNDGRLSEGEVLVDEGSGLAVSGLDWLGDERSGLGVRGMDWGGDGLHGHWGKLNGGGSSFNSFDGHSLDWSLDGNGLVGRGGLDGDGLDSWGNVVGLGVGLLGTYCWATYCCRWPSPLVTTVWSDSCD